jgi:hypothetical protein
MRERSKMRPGKNPGEKPVDPKEVEETIDKIREFEKRGKPLKVKKS